MSKVNLDPVEERANEARRPTTVPGYLVTKAEIAAVVASARDVPALVAELRAAREALRLAPRPPTFNTNTRAYVDAVAAYDKVTGERS